MCEKNGYVKPAVYQGAYNAITRLAEENLFPVLRKHGMSFAAFRLVARTLKPTLVFKHMTNTYPTARSQVDF